MLFLFLASGLFLGWSLGANDAGNVFGTAVGSGMIKFRKAAIVASLFVILGATLQGTGATRTLSQLGSVDALGGAFTVALCAAAVVAWMTYKKLPVSTSQAIVGAIIGWCFFSSSPVDYTTLVVITTSWLTGPILGAVLAALLYLLMRTYIRKSRVHVIKLDARIRYGLLVAGAFGAFSLGANNIANVMGVFVNASNFTIQIGDLIIPSSQVLFFVGGLAIAAGILTYSKKVMSTLGEGILELTPETALVVVLSQALVLFLFSSSTLSDFLVRTGLPPIPLVPVSSTQVIVGSLIGIGMVKGVQEIRFKLLGNIMAGWLLTPIFAGALTFISLFFVSNVFKITVMNGIQPVNSAAVPQDLPVNIQMPAYPVFLWITLIALVLVLFAGRWYFGTSEHRIQTRYSMGQWNEKQGYASFPKEFVDIEVQQEKAENKPVANQFDTKRKELVNHAHHLSESRRFLESVYNSLEQAQKEPELQKKNERIQGILVDLHQKMNDSEEIRRFYKELEMVSGPLPSKMTAAGSHLTGQEKKLALLLRLGLSSKEIAPLLGISPKSVDIARYRLRKKLDLKKEDNLIQFINTV